jgi:hypothetical protein
LKITLRTKLKLCKAGINPEDPTMEPEIPFSRVIYINRNFMENPPKKILSFYLREGRYG